jgi:hypothetical protein
MFEKLLIHKVEYKLDLINFNFLSLVKCKNILFKTKIEFDHKKPI